MNERQVVILHHDGANLIGGTAVDALAGLDDHGTHSLLLELLERHGNLALPSGLLLLGELGTDGLLQSLDLTDTGELVGVAKGGCHLVVVGEDALLDLLDGLVERVLLLDDGAVDLLPLGDKLVLSTAEGSKGLWPNFMAASMSSSEISSAPASTIEMKSAEPPSSVSRSEFSRSS